MPHDSRKEPDAVVDTIFEWIIPEVPLVLDHAPVNVEATADAKGATQTANLCSQKSFGTVRLAVGTALDGDRRARTTSRETVGSVVIALPELVLGHVATEELPSHPPLAARSTDCVEATLGGNPARCLGHWQLPPTTGWVCLRPVVEEKDQRKCQRGSEDPDEIGYVLHAWVDRFESVGDDSKAPIATAPLVPAGTAILGDAVRCTVHDIIGRVHGETILITVF